MARYVLVEFENDEQADKLRQMIEAQTRAGKPYRIAGIFARPKTFCRCPTPTGYHKNQIVRGSKFGWWVCVVCKKARKGSHNANNLIAAVDTDEMPGENPMRGYEYRVDNISIFEVPTGNIKRERTKEL